MKSLTLSFILLSFLFSSCDTKSTSAEKAAETQMPTTAPIEKPTPTTAPVETKMTTATKSVTIKDDKVPIQSTLPAFAVKYVGRKGYYINGKFLGELSNEKATQVMADSMTAYKKRGGIIPKDLNIEIVHDEKTSAPIMGQSGAIRDAFADAMTLNSGATNATETIADVKDGTTCYLSAFKKDITRCKLTIKGDKVTGTYDWIPDGKDSAMGTLKGKKNGNIITAIYSYIIEGSNQTEEVMFMLDNGVLKKGVAELVDLKNDGHLVFKDKSTIKYSEVMTQGDCGKIFK